MKLLLKFITNKNQLLSIFKKENPSYVIHLAAQAGVRYSFEKPQAYVSSNIEGTNNILECIHLKKPSNLSYH